MVIVELSNLGNLVEVWWIEFIGEMNTCSLFGLGWVLFFGWGSSSVLVEENKLI